MIESVNYFVYYRVYGRSLRDARKFTLTV